MKITIGILAWNEESSIKRTLQSLFSQTLLSTKDIPIDVICVPNGSTDATETIARTYFEQKKVERSGDRLNTKIEVLSEPGKANAWNHLVHTVADEKTDIFFFIDADIEMANSSTLDQLLLTFAANPEAVAVTDQPMGKTGLNEGLNILGWLQTRNAQITQNLPGQLCGQLYALRGEFARRVWLPKGLIIEDGFLKSLIVTDCYRSEINLRRIAQAPNASHWFVPYTSIREIFRHQLRQVIGQTMNDTLISWLSAEVKRNAQWDVGRWIQQENIRNPRWVFDRLKKRSSQRWWVLYPGALSQRFRRLKGFSLARRIALAFVAVLGFIFDLPVFIVANYRLKNLDSVQSLWSKSSN